MTGRRGGHIRPRSVIRIELSASVRTIKMFDRVIIIWKSERIGCVSFFMESYVVNGIWLKVDIIFQQFMIVDVAKFQNKTSLTMNIKACVGSEELS